MKRYLRNVSLGIMLICLLIILAVSINSSLDYPKMKSTSCLENYTREELDFFSEVGFLFVDRVNKWEDDISISFDGKQMESDALVIDSIVSEIAPLIFPVKIHRTMGMGNLVFRFVKDTIDQQDYGFTQYKKISFTRKIQQVEIQIFPKVKGQAREACIRHEFLHALGLVHPKRRNTGTIIESLVEYIDDTDNVKLYKYMALDKSSIKILYSDCIPMGLKRETFLKAR